MHRIFIDGQNGTTGLQIQDRLAERDDIELIELSDAERKTDTAKRAALRAADVAILCLPDDAARQTAGLTTETRLIDASTAHRTDPDWTYGLPELCPEQRQNIKNAMRVSNPGCYPTGFILLLRPLIALGLLKPDPAHICQRVERIFWRRQGHDQRLSRTIPDGLQALCPNAQAQTLG